MNATTRWTRVIDQAIDRWPMFGKELRTVRDNFSTVLEKLQGRGITIADDFFRAAEQETKPSSRLEKFEDELLRLVKAATFVLQNGPAPAVTACSFQEALARPIALEPPLVPLDRVIAKGKDDLEGCHRDMSEAMSHPMDVRKLYSKR